MSHPNNNACHCVNYYYLKRLRQNEKDARDEDDDVNGISGAFKQGPSVHPSMPVMA